MPRYCQKSLLIEAVKLFTHEYKGYYEQHTRFGYFIYLYALLVLENRR
jgi:hypothetical protein